MNKLPEEILITIFRYLSHTDLKLVREVCTEFYNAATDTSLIQNEILTIDHRLLKLEGHKIITFLMKSSRIFYNIIVTAIEYHDFFKIFQKFGNNFKIVTLKRCILNHHQFTNIVLQCQNLEALYVTSCDYFLIEGKIFCSRKDELITLPKLKILEISKSIYLTDKAISRFLAICPNIQYFNLKNIIINCHQGVYNFNYNINKENVLQIPSLNVLTVNYVQAVIQSKRYQLRGLDFSDTKINNVALAEILNTENLKLNYLNLTNCRELKRSNTFYLAGWQSNITELYLSNCDLITNSCLFEVCTYMTELNILDLSNSKFISSEGFLHLSSLLNLRELNISNCIQLNGKFISATLCTNKLAKSLRKLKLNNTDIDNDNMIRMASVLHLDELEISNCNNIADSCLSTIYLYQKQLKSLHMAGLSITNKGITGFENKEFITNCENKNLKSFQNDSLLLLDKQNELLFESNKLFLKIKSLFNECSNSVKNLNNLKCLNLSKCKELSDIICFNALCFQSLRELNLSGVLQITTYAYSLAFNCPTIELLDLSGTTIDDVGICIIVIKLKRLKYLSVKNCRQITNLSLQFIIQHCQKLQILNIEGCSNLNFELMEKVKNIPSIITVKGNPNERYTFDNNVPLPPPIPNLFV